MKLKYNIEIDLNAIKIISGMNNGLLQLDYLKNYSEVIKYTLKSDNKIKDIKIEGIIEL